MPKNRFFSFRIIALASMLLLLMTSSCGEDVRPETDESTIVLTLRIRTFDQDFPAPSRFWGPQVTRGPMTGFPCVQALDLALRDGIDPLVPVAGVRVALDLPDGTRLGEADSDITGLVEFEVPVDQWPEGTAASATAFKEDFMMHTLAQIERPSEDALLSLTLHPLWEDPLDDEMVEISGTAVDLLSSGVLAMQSTAPYGTWYERANPNWSLETPAGVPFDLIAISVNSYSHHSNWAYFLDFAGWARVSSEGLEEDTVLDISFVDDAVVPTVIDGSFSLPERDDSPLREETSRPFVMIRSAGSYFTGFVGYGVSHRLRGRNLSYTAELIETPEYGGNWYQYWVETGISPYTGMPRGEGKGQSYAIGRGLPKGQQAQLLDLPEWISEAPSDEGFPIDETLSWTVFDDDVHPCVWISTRGEVVWVIQLPDDATSVDLPAPPSNVNLTTLLGAHPGVTVGIEYRIDADEGVFWLEAWGPELELDTGE